jgi:hypothetical protein
VPEGDTTKDAPPSLPEALRPATGNSSNLTRTVVLPLIEKEKKGVPGATNLPPDVDDRILQIIEKFPPYEGNGVERSKADTVDLKCKDCKFKFRTMLVVWTFGYGSTTDCDNRGERDDHYLSKYCGGSDIVLYRLRIDRYNIKRNIDSERLQLII